MLRKLYKRVLVLGLLGGAAGPGAAWAQQLATSPEAAIWAATAAYVYQDDPKLVTIQPELLHTIKNNSVKAFGLSIDEAVALEKKQLNGQKDLLKFQELFKTVQAQPLTHGDPAALAQAIVSKLDDNAERMADPARATRFAQLTQQLTQLAAAPAPTAPVAAAPPTDNPMNQIGAAPAAAASSPVLPALAVSQASLGTPAPGLLLWLALGAAVLALLGVAVLWNKLTNTRAKLATLRRTVDVLSQKPAGSSAPPTLTTAIKQEITRQMDQRIAEKKTRVAVPAAAAPPAELIQEPEPVTEAAEAPPAAPAPRLRTQYVGEAPFNQTFTARSLSDQPGPYSMFAIESSEEQPDQGTFTVVGNLASHVRDHSSVLEPVCEYVSGYPRGNETRVVTEQPGLVRRQGSDWAVTQPARVRFE